MYVIDQFMLKKGNQCFRLKWLLYRANGKLYHSENGVYGYKPSQRKHFEVPKQYLDERSRQSNFYRLVSAYRAHGHKQAKLNPVSTSKLELLSELQPKNFGLNLMDKVCFRGILFTQQYEGTIEEAIRFLQATYCGTIGTEFGYLETEEEREWFAETVETILAEPLNNETRKTIAMEMLKSQTFDNFLATKFVSLKRYGGEGAESMMAFFHEFFKLCVYGNLDHVIMCAAHRGRLNLLTGLLNFPPEKLFHKLRGHSEFPDTAKCTGDVISHLVTSTNLRIDNKSLHVTMLRNPSHLEIVNPVSMGKTRGIMQVFKEAAYGDNENAQWSDKVINIQIHGDAAYPGQGVNQECLTLSRIPHFEIGGTIHLIINNQLGFTTPTSRSRSSRYCTDLAKIISAPVIHVNGDDPEMVVRVARIAFKYQRQFRKDVFIDLNCFRRWGHNELDDPTITNPLMYKIIRNRASIPDRYTKKLIDANIFTQESVKNIVEGHTAWLNKTLKESSMDISEQSITYFAGRWSKMKQAEDNITRWDTGVEPDLLRFVGEKSVQVPPNFNIHPQLLKNHVQNRLKRIESGNALDWSTAEALAMGSLLYQGYNVRLSGQDVGRGTFSQRHAMLVDQSTEGDDNVEKCHVTKVILVSGKHYYALKNYRENSGDKNVAIIRIENLCPFPVYELLEEISKYKHAKTFIWSQEEPRNMGAWSFIKPRFENLCGRQLKYCGQEAMAAPAVGDGQMHQRKANEVIVKPFTLK
ncbi:probable 2-oxoglutarate dehydrogenase E1 component DHKTD1 homolog, mitochondrial isoform X3 [Monomorium pharaonis]|uniref:probable 2-oxoglutarate dehydrogenase E1 component DHKTD1 homolog, mitochondrial isoform X3 n=1 Tax=Monomorium pharaonis TaxID=307658 RepID=UPI00063F5A70|nr:probable 2-oxoglutarate dehydrogenase E1 component DHKTD1 homolog, mitochondrial isoform X3 [Monomorium pharaonis]